MEDMNTKLGALEQQLYSKYPHLHPQQPQPQYQQPQHVQYSQQEIQDQQVNQQQQVEKYKLKICDMLQDLYNEEYKKMACNFMVDELKYILSMPLTVKDRLALQEELNKLTGKSAVTEESEYKSVDQLLNRDNKEQNKPPQNKHNNHNNKNKNS